MAITSTVTTRAAGFDLTDIPADKFAQILTELGLQDRGLVQVNSYHAFCFQNNELVIYTGNHPITGQYNREGGREAEVGYASYMGIEGESKAVAKAVRLIKKYATYIKGYSPKTREYI